MSRHAYKSGRYKLPFVGHCNFAKSAPIVDWDRIEAAGARVWGIRGLRPPNLGRRQGLPRVLPRAPQAPIAAPHAPRRLVRKLLPPLAGSEGSNVVEVQMNRMSWLQYRERLSSKPPVFLPVGALEQHGPHLPLGTDAMLASAIAAAAAAAVEGIVAPALAYGYKSQPKCGGGQHFCGTTSLDAATLIGQVRDAIREFVRHGVERLVLVNGHYENQWFLIEGADLALRECRGERLAVMRMEYWDFCTERTLAAIFPQGFPGFALEHAAVIETSLMLHFHPELVRIDRIPDDPAADFPPYDLYPTPTDWVPPSGVLSSARAASAGKGVLIADEVIARIAQAVRTEL